MQDFKKVSQKFLNKFPAQPYLGYFRYQLTKYQLFQIYYYYYYYCYDYCYIIIITITVIYIIIVCAKILGRCGAVRF